MTNNDVELTVEKIDKIKKSMNVNLYGKYALATTCGGFAMLTAIVVCSCLPAAFATGFAAIMSKLAYNSYRDKIREEKEIIDDLKSTITYTDYQKYNKSKIKSMNRSGFAPSSTTKK